jgi:NAD(P)-dependent dehydrogenase (short-subunit alcohol dehydrogenase family)
MRNLALVVVLTTLGWIPVGGPHQAPDPQAAAPDDQRAILITGASTGIGRATTEYLASKGFFVYAGARKEQDLADLSALDNVQGIRLDVTIQSEIDAAVETVRAGGRGLYGLINNAGVAVVAPLIEMSEADLQFQLDVNVYGPWRVTAAFAPLIIESQGRISTTGSISGVLPWSLGGAYCMSKHAVEAFTDVLAQELAPFDVQVSVIEPGNYNSEISKSHRQRFIDSGYSSEGSLYKRQMDGLLGGEGDRSMHKEPTEVAEAFYAAMTDIEPKQHYMVVPNEGEADITIRAVIRRLVQLNDSQAYTYDRDELVAMLDEALAATGR